MDTKPTDTMKTQQDTDHTKIETLIFEQRAITNARNRLNYHKRKAEGRNHQLKSSSELRLKGRKLKPITIDDIQLHISTRLKAKE